MPASASDRVAARAAADAFGFPREERPSVYRYWDPPEEYSIPIAACRDRPTPGYTTYTTLGLHHTPNVMDDRDIRVEIAGVARSDVEEFPNLLSTAAFYVIKDGWLCAPGVVFRELLNEYDLSSTLEHVMFVTPFPWPELGTVDVGDGLTAHWLLAVPISESERRLLLDVGYDRFEEVMEQNEVAYYDVDRDPVVTLDT